MSRRTAAGIAVLALLAVLAGAAPYRSILPLFPCGDDATMWFLRTDPARPDWADWVLFDNHFVAYRPVTGLVFALNHALLGPTPRAWRAVDIALHLLAGLGVAAAFRALAAAVPGRPRRPGGAVVAAALFWASPVGESVVPFVARRSYSLATALGLAAVAGWARAEASDGRGARVWRAAAAGLLLAAVLANETAFVLVPVLALVSVAVRHRSEEVRSVRALAASLAPIALVTVLAAGARLAVLGGLGGYRRNLTARVEDGVRTVAVGSSPLEVFALAWRAAGLPDTPSGDPSFPLALGGAAAGAVLAAWAAAVSAWAMRGRQDGGARGDPLPALLLVWALGYALLAAVSGTWFVRMAYPMVAPVAMGLAWAAGEAVAAARARSLRGLALAPVGVVLVAWVQVATPVRGLDRKPIREQYRTSRFLRKAADALVTLEPPALVWVAAPVAVPQVDSTVWWLRGAAPAGIAVRPLAGIAPRARAPRGRMVEVDGGRVRLAADGARWEPSVSAAGLGPIAVRSLVRGRRPTWIFDAGELVRLGDAAPDGR